MAPGDDDDLGSAATVAPRAAAPPPISGIEPTIVPARMAGSPAPSGADATHAAGTDAPPLPSPGATAGPTTQGTASADPVDPLAAASAVHGAADLPVVAREHYRMISEFARGGLGSIVKARDKRTGRIVAIKQTLTSSDDAARRFAREALITANLQHPAIVPVYELGRWPTGEPFYAMKLVAGRSFEDVLAAAPTLDARLAHLPVIISVADALAYAHDKRVIHRDLKPANVLVGDFGETVVIDWGLAKVIGSADAPARDSLDVPPAARGDGDAGATIDGAVMGTPHYMPPEQARGERVDARADVYAIGAMLYQLVAGLRPFGDRRATSVGELLVLVSDATPTPLRTLQPTAPPDLLTIAAKAMARDPAARYASAGELAADLRRFTTGQLVQAHHYDRRTLLRRWLRRNRAPITVAAILLGLSAAGAVVSIRRILDETDTAHARERDAVTAREQADAQATAARQSLGQALFEKGLVEESSQRWAAAAVYYADAARLVRDPTRARWAAGLAEAVSMFPQARHRGHTGRVTGAGILPDGSRAITVDDAGDLHAWTPATGALVASRHFDHPLEAVAVSPRGDELVVGEDTGDILRVDAATLATRAMLRGHTARIWQLAYSPDGALVASASEDTTARIWRGDVATQTLRGHTQRVYTVAFAPDGARVATASDDRTAWIWDVATGRGRAVGHHNGGGVRAVLFAPDGLVTAGWDYVIHVWSPGGGGDDGRAWADTGSVHAAVLSPDARALLTAGDSGAIRVWDLASRQPITVVDVPGGGRTLALAMSRDGRWLVSAGDAGDPIAWDTRALPRLDPVGHRASVSALRYARDGATFVSGAADHTLRLWDAATFEQRLRISTGAAECQEGALIAPDGSVVSGCSDNKIRRWVDGALARELATDVQLRFTAESPDGAQAAMGHMNGRLAILDLATFTLVAEKTLHAHQIYDVQWIDQVIGAAPASLGTIPPAPASLGTIAPAPASLGTILTASLDDHVRTWSMPGLVPGLDLRAGTKDGVLSARLSPDGSQLAIGTETDAIDVWDVRARRWLARDVGRADRAGTVWAIIYAPDGSRAYTATNDGKLRVWDTRTWRDPQVVDAGEGAPHAFAVSRDAAGATLLVGFESGAIVAFDRATMAVRAHRRSHARPRQLRDARDRDLARRRSARARRQRVRARRRCVLRPAARAHASEDRRRRRDLGRPVMPRGGAATRVSVVVCDPRVSSRYCESVRARRSSASRRPSSRRRPTPSPRTTDTGRTARSACTTERDPARARAAPTTAPTSWSTTRCRARCRSRRSCSGHGADAWRSEPRRPRPPLLAARSAASRSSSGLMNRPVWLRATFAICSGVPAAMISPPALPPSGPRSITQSAVFTTSRLCSITSTVLPLSTSRFSTSSSFLTSPKCRPVVGSSSRYSVRPVCTRASSRASFTRCASPPDSVVAGWPSDT
jgi:WD40 repeat protein/serine/threonine protein kinase